MDREKFLQSIKDSIQDGWDAIVYEVTLFFYKKRFPFEVMYEGMIRSWVPLEGKKPLGVIFKSNLVTLHNSSNPMSWSEFMKYCEKVKIEGHACEAREIEIWNKLFRLSERRKQAFDELMVRLGGEPIALSKKWFWSSSNGKSCYSGIKFYLIFTPLKGDVIRDFFVGDDRYVRYVRPVLALS